MPYVVMVDDNYHYGDEDERYQAGVYATAEEAVARCKKIVDGSLEECSGDTADAIYKQYTSFGDDAFVVARDAPPVTFSAWDYAKQRCEELATS